MSENDKQHNKPDKNDDSDDTFSVNLGVLKAHMTGQLVKTLVPYLGWCMIVMAIAYAACLVIGAFRNGP